MHTRHEHFGFISFSLCPVNMYILKKDCISASSRHNSFYFHYSNDSMSSAKKNMCIYFVSASEISPVISCISELAGKVVAVLCKKRRCTLLIPFQARVVHLSARPFVPERGERDTDVLVSPRGTEQHLVTTNCFSFIVELKLLSASDFFLLVQPLPTQSQTIRTFSRRGKGFLRVFHSAGRFFRCDSRLLIFTICT